ncbi:MAG: DoxX family protein [Terracidiphilus sp.]
MNTVLWIVQILLAAVFLFTGASKLLAYEELVRAVERRSKGGKIGMTRLQAGIVGLLEIVGAAGVIFPAPPYGLLRLAAGGLGLLMVVAGIYHLRRQESATPSVVLFLMAVFVIVGRWPVQHHF